MHTYDELREVHGNLLEWQCARGCEQTRVPMSTLVRFEVDDQFRARKVKTSRVAALTRKARVDPNRPRCADCKGPLRPAVLMFADTEWVDNKDQERRYRLWKKGVLKLGRRHPWVRMA